MTTTSDAAPRATLLEPEKEALTPGSARSLLLSILGELVWPTAGPVWTGTLVYMLRGLGIEEQTARQAIARAAASDWIVAERRGREVSWSLSPRLVRIFESDSPRVYSLSDPFSGWDGRWISLYTTIPKTHRGARRPLYAGLTWAGFGNPTPGLWLSPHVERATEVGALVSSLELTDQTVMLIGSVASFGLTEAEIVRRGWDLAALVDHYERILAGVDALEPSDGDEMLFAEIRLISEWRELPRTDPQLPEALLPDWIGRRASRRIAARRAKWTPAVRARYVEINASPRR